MEQLEIGNVFTPLDWGIFAVKESGIYEQWLLGASVFDPTMGEGHLLEALIRCGLEEGIPIEELPTRQLFGNELNLQFSQRAVERFMEKYNLDMSTNFSQGDILTLPEKPYDLILGNPPWKNFVDLPKDYKEQIKPYFFEYDLVENRKHLLLGGSRIDISALIIQRSIKDFLKEKGKAVFFIPLSLLLNDGANRNFRKFSVGGIRYSVRRVFDFNETRIFAGVTTRYGIIEIQRDEGGSFPVPYLRLIQGSWCKYHAMPVFHHNDPWSVMDTSSSIREFFNATIEINPESKPRQGINTGGANDLFFFDSCRDAGEANFELSNKRFSSVILPKRYVFPLISHVDFKNDAQDPNRWVFLPYHSDGRPLGVDEVSAIPELENYLNKNRMFLGQRKGLLLGKMISGGIWWKLLGVGSYTFFPYKVVWEAYGRHQFRPRIFEGSWQVNQSLQAYIPVRTFEEAKRVLQELQKEEIEQFLISLKMEGTMNWAQPGKIKKLLRYRE